LKQISEENRNLTDTITQQNLELQWIFLSVYLASLYSIARIR